MAKPLKILHFADAHIDMANYGRHDPHSGLPMRVMDFLKSLDRIIDTAIQEKVDMVLFAGDAYKDRTPAPTFQREWGRRIMRLSRAGIPTLLLVGNHDLSPALGRAHAIEEFLTLEVPHIRVLDRPDFLKPEDLNLPLQVIALPWISRSGMIAKLGLSAVDPAKVFEEMEARITQLIKNWLDEADPDLPTILTAHASVQGALYGNERNVMLGNDLVLPRSLVCDPRLDYTALGHIHKPQDLNEGSYPAVIYPGSIERVDFGEAGDDKYFMIVHLEKKKTRPEWRKLDCIRPFIDCTLTLEDHDEITSQIIASLPPQEELAGAVVRLVLEYPRDWEARIDDAFLRDYLKEAFEFHLVKRPQASMRIRLPEDQSIGSLTHLELLEKYLDARHVDGKEGEELLKLAEEVIKEG
jgi:DNA repair protein SbcD/Mre11